MRYCYFGIKNKFFHQKYILRLDSYNFNLTYFSYAFLDFHSAEAAQKALRSHQGHKVKGQKIQLAFAAEPTSNQPYKVLKIRGLPPKSTVQSVKKLLPTASSAHMPTNASTHKHKGYGSIRKPG